MAASLARTAVGQPSHRTNSLGYAKSDCHTCLELKRICNRQRPRCGPCLASRQRCGGFATNLVWKDVEVPNLAECLAPGSGTVSPKMNSRRWQNQSGTKDRGFKFVKGRMKRKRNPQLLPSQQESPSAADDVNGSNMNDQNNQSVIYPSPWLANPETMNDLSALIEEECVQNCSDCDGLASELSECGLPIEHSHFALRR